MQIDFTLLTTLHRLLRQKTDLLNRIRRGPHQIALAEKAEADFLQELEQVKQAKTQVRMAADRKQLQLNEREANINSLQGKLNAAETNREYQLLKEHIAADDQANSVLSDEILELLERLDSLDQQQLSAEGNFQKAQQELERVRQRVQAERSSLQQQLDSVIAELTTYERQLLGDVGAEYRRLAAKRGEDALALTDLHTCGNCHTKITTQHMSELMLKRAVFCQSCGSLFYLIENKAVTN